MIEIKAVKAIDINGCEVAIRGSISQSNGVYSLQVEILNECSLKEIVLFDAPHNMSTVTNIYGEGYQKLAQYGGNLDKLEPIGYYTDYDHYHMPKNEEYNTVYNYAIFSTLNDTLLIGATSSYRFRVEIRFNSKRMVIAQIMEGLHYKKGDTIQLEKMFIACSNDRNQLLRDFGQLIEKEHPMRRYCEEPVGWCSWYCIGPNISEKKIFNELKIIKDKMPQLKYIQIDDGFQPYMGDWLDVSDKFDRSMKEICADIRSAGFEPAIWLAPFIASAKSKLFQNHPDYFVKDIDGNPLCSSDVTFGGWRDAPWYMLDATNPEAAKYIYDVVHTVYHEWGVKYYKLDANVWGALPFGNRYDKNATAIEAYRLGMEAVWQATGDDAFILGCNAPMWPSLGLVSGMRVTGDIIRKPHWMMKLAQECFHRNWMNNVLWVNDPDCLTLHSAVNRPINTIMKPFAWITKSNRKYKYNNIYVRASGGLVLSGDYVGLYSNKDIDLVKRIIDAPSIAAQFDEEYEIGKICYDDKIEYCVFNNTTKPKRYSVEVPSGYRITDMYKNKPIKCEGNAYEFKLSKYDAAWLKLEK